MGDSVAWGQGLREIEKYDAMVRDALRVRYRGSFTLDRLAHSGALIGATPVTGNPAPGEVPASRPTIVEQCDGFMDSPETVDLLLVNGGINDVGVATILNPFAVIPSLSSRVKNACHTGMLALLEKVRAKFTKPSCKILITGYYTILSRKSDPLKIPRLLSMHGIAVPAFVDAADFVNPVVRRCEEFFADSTAQLKLAVADANDRRVAFVPSGFSDDNVVFVPSTSLLFGLNAELNSQDPIAADRHCQCNTAHSDPL